MSGPLLADRVKETSSTTGTGDMFLEGATAGGFRTFSSVLALGDTTYYAIQNTSANEWETGRGTYQAGVLQRTEVFASSNANSLVNFSTGSKQVFITVPSAITSPLTVAAVAPTAAPADGALYLDTAASRLYVRSNGTWKYVTLT